MIPHLWCLMYDDVNKPELRPGLLISAPLVLKEYDKILIAINPGQLE